MNSSRTDENLSIMVNSDCRPSRRRKIQRRHAPSIQDLQSLMTFLGKGIKQYTSSPTRISTVST